MTRTHGRGARGERVVGHAPKNWGDSLTLVAALTTEAVLAPIIFRGAMNAPTFLGYIEQALLPVLRPGDRLVMDNLAAHRDPRVIAMLADANVVPVFLPPYSPDLNPIELAWAKLKTLLRGAGPRTVDALLDALGDALRAVSRHDCFAWVRHCGYAQSPWIPPG
jgi:transposase